MVYLFRKNKVIEKHIITSKRGEYWRLLRPGTYEIKARHENMVSQPIQIRVEDKNVEIKDLILLP